MVRGRKINANVMAGAGVRRRRNTGPKMNGGTDATIVEYSSIGETVATDANGLAVPRRLYIPGNSNHLSNTIGPSVVGFYATGKFLPGTKLRWEPSVPFTVSGRIYVAFIDNPEVMAAFQSLPTAISWVNAVKGIGAVVSFPVWQETDVTFPTLTRRKRFDINVNTTVDANVYDRSAQTFMVAGVDGAPASTSLGSFWFHDKVSVEGMNAQVT